MCMARRSRWTAASCPRDSPDDSTRDEKFHFDRDAVAALLDNVVFPGHTVAEDAFPLLSAAAARASGGGCQSS